MIYDVMLEILELLNQGCRLLHLANRFNLCFGFAGRHRELVVQLI